MMVCSFGVRRLPSVGRKIEPRRGCFVFPFLVLVPLSPVGPAVDILGAQERRTQMTWSPCGHVGRICLGLAARDWHRHSFRGRELFFAKGSKGSRRSEDRNGRFRKKQQPASDGGRPQIPKSSGSSAGQMLPEPRLQRVGMLRKEQRGRSAKCGLACSFRDWRDEVRRRHKPPTSLGQTPTKPSANARQSFQMKPWLPR